MQISRNFNRFYHSLIREFYFKSPKRLKVEGIGVLYTRAFTINGFKQILKMINLDYPRDENGDTLSTRDVSSKALTEHIEFIFKLAGENGIELDVIKQEWELILRRANESVYI